MLHKDYNRRYSIEKKKILVVSLKGLGVNTNWLAVNRQSWSNCDSDSLASSCRSTEELGEQGEKSREKYKDQNGACPSNLWSG
jgi:hypothetical protein